MSGLYQLPGLLLTALCHVIVIYHIAEHRYSKKKFVLRSIVVLLAAVLYKKYAAVILRSLTNSGKRWWNLALIALLFYLLQAAVSVLNAGNFISNGYLLLAFAAISFLMCTVYGVVFSNVSYMKKDAEAALIRQNAASLFQSGVKFRKN